MNNFYVLKFAGFFTIRHVQYFSIKQLFFYGLILLKCNNAQKLIRYRYVKNDTFK